MKKSIGLLSALVVSTTFIVNCQKAPDKRRVRPSGGSGAQTDVVGEKAKLPTKVCSKDLMTEFTSFSALYKKVTAAKVSEQSTAEELKAMQADLVTALDKCDKLIPQFTALGESENFGCLKDGGVKSEENSLTKAQVTQWCNYAGVILERDHNHPNAYSTAAKDAKKAEANIKEIEAKFLGKDFKVSDEVINMMYEGRTNLASFLANGEIQTDKSQAMTASQTVCTAIGTGIAQDQVLKSPTLEFIKFEKAEKSAFKDIGVEYNEKATLVSFTLKEIQEENNESNEPTTTAGALLCLNLPFEKLTAAQLETAFGKAITLAPTKVTTEVTGGTTEAAVVSTPAASSASATTSSTTHASDKLAASKPEGSPQLKLLDEAVAQSTDKATKETEQKAADEKAAQEKAAADKKAADEKAAKEEKAKEEAAAKEEKQAAAPVASATVTVAPAQAASSPVQVEEKVVETEFTALKEKAARLEQEAKDAEAEVKKLEAEKAKAEDIAQAKTKARITRESANAAMKELNSAAKAAGFTKYI